MKKSTKDGLKDGVSADEFASMRDKLRDAVPPIGETEGL